jgi:adenylate cyclase
MAKERAQRRLAAILAADVVGYSRLTEQDEAGTLEALADRRKAVLEPLFAKYHGRVVRLMGDGTLAEFASAVDAVQCAVDIQRAMKEANAKQSNDRAIVLRVGLNLGDVVVEDGDLYGDGVNVAARLEAMADPGGICLSAAIHQQVERLLPFAFRDLGDQTLKNIARPVRVYCIAHNEEMGDSHRIGTPTGRTFSAQSKLSVAVLPFVNMSGDPEQEYFSDGITEDIITGLTHFGSLLVIARNSSFQYRERPNLRQVGRELGVHYVVEGSVRKAGNRIRISAQLLDATTGRHLWAEHYDRELKDVFAVQDEVARTIVVTLEGRIALGGAERAQRKPTDRMDAYDCVLQAREPMNRYNHPAAEPLLIRAIAADPVYCEAHARLAIVLVVKFRLDGERNHLSRAKTHAEQALALDSSNELAHSAMAIVYTYAKQFDLAGVHFDRSILLNPNNPRVATMHALWLTYVGRPNEALQRLDETVRWDPFPTTWYWRVRGETLFQLRRYKDAIEAFNNMPIQHAWDHAYLAAAYAHAGLLDDAHGQLTAYRAAGPTIALADFVSHLPYKDQQSLDHLIEGLRKAGLRE